MTLLDPIALPDSPRIQPLQTDVANQKSLFSANNIAIAILWLIPPVFIAGLIWRYSVDVPVWDDIIIGKTVQLLISDGFSIGQLFAQHNEARPAVLRIIFRLLYIPMQWDVRSQMAVSFLVVLCTSMVMIRICRSTIQNPLTAVVAVLLINFMLFSPVQWQCFLWGMELICFISTLPLVIMIACLGLQMALWISMPVAILMAITANFASSNGMLLWPLAVPFLLVHPSRHRFKALSLWITLAVICQLLFFHHYTTPPNTPSFYKSISILSWDLIFKFVPSFPVAFLGNGVRVAFDYWTDFFVGAPALVIWVLGVLYLVMFGRNLPLWRKALPWVVLGSYSIFSGMLTTLGRFGFGPMAAVVARYSTFAIPFWISIVPLWIVIFDYHLPVRTWRKQVSVALTSLGALVIVGLMLAGCIFVRGEMLDWNAAILAARSVAQFSLVVPDNDAMGTTLLPTEGVLMARGAIAAADHADLFHPACFRSNDISTIAVEYYDPTLINGYFDQIKTDGKQLSFSGWACLPPQRTPANVVLLTTPDKNGVERIFAIAGQAHEVRYDVAAAMSVRALDRSGWKKTIDADRLPHGTVVSAWAYDTYGRRAYKLNQSLPIP